jgi:hypothetical protein
VNKFFPILVLVSLLVVSVIGCGSPPISIPSPTSTPTPIIGPIVVVIPFGPSVSVVRGNDEVGYDLKRVSADSARGVTLPDGYRVPRRIEITGTKGLVYGKNFLVLFGPGDLPVIPDRIIRQPLTEEIRIGPLREGLTQVLFE